MLRDIRKNKVFNRRAFFLGIGQGSLAGILALRLGYLQLYKHKDYSIQSDGNRIKTAINPAPRGTIYDCNDIALTENEGNYRLLIYLGRKTDSKKIIDDLVRILDLEESKRELFLNKVANARRRSIVSLMDNLDWSDLARIESNSFSLPGISIESGIIRKYPYPEETAHVVGYVSTPSETDSRNAESSLFMHPDFKIGKFGVERTFDEYLRGRFGVKYFEVNSLDVPLRLLSTDESKDGSSLNLTIDLRLQKYITERISLVTASVVVMDVKTGEIISYVSSPSFNPNNFVEGVSREYWHQVTSDKNKPLSNKPISALYPPGSTFKLMVALTALEEGFNPSKKIYCPGHYQLGRRRFHCWKEGGHGSVNLRQAIEQSCNTYFYSIANQIDMGKVAKMAKKFGYGQEFDVSLHGFKKGVMPNEEWKKRVIKAPWVGGDNLNTAIGQGFVLTNPLQMAVITARIANGGVPITPYLVKSKKALTQYDSLKSDNLADIDHVTLVQKGMFDVVNGSNGTARGSRLPLKEITMSGKTGTSQVVSKRESEMTKEENETK